MGPAQSDTRALQQTVQGKITDSSEVASGAPQKELPLPILMVKELSGVLEALTPSGKFVTPELQAGSRAIALSNRTKAGESASLERSQALVGICLGLKEGDPGAELRSLVPASVLEQLRDASLTLELNGFAVRQGHPLTRGKEMMVESAAMTWVQIASRLVAAIPLEQNPESTQHSFSWNANRADAGSVHRPFTLKAPTSTGAAPVGPGAGLGPTPPVIPPGSAGPGAGPIGVVDGPLIDLTLPRRP